ncbi:hypothetical protein PF010_g16344 [Phytophthora fragariae]|uniref:Secreted protein n=2 Tax=Phytophthora TaxID=4783 RepID=A0A6A3TAQ6_9STRA|nr:hypothetical protein PF009_g18045 [Phytophthora fragariae]KAE9033239.1 hypothetical protein PR002_g8775 [Phytophthora rubi]KAE8998174.1 hypothetical protein PF011_g15162 [Phytophthora fragariae]KAE9037152.1 hypothetical protein PR001_g8505 [Phytophthora rubi]KAE9096443.1 hypothetical protein PF010_g16344 [Phytophthora fragariae]
MHQALVAWSAISLPCSHSSTACHLWWASMDPVTTTTRSASQTAPTHKHNSIAPDAHATHATKSTATSRQVALLHFHAP